MPVRVSPPRCGRVHFLFFFFAFLCFLWWVAFLAFGHSVTAIFVSWSITAPFCATNSVGIVSLLLQRFESVPSAE